MWGGEKEDLGAGVYKAFPVEGKDLVAAMAAGNCELRVEIFEEDLAGGLGFAGAAQEDRRCFMEPRVMQEQACELSARVAADAHDGRAGRGGVREGGFESL